jgi:hypothetical protein
MPTAEERLQHLLHTGDEDVRTVPTPPGAPALTVARRPAR